ncbi:MAG: hypothetical protein HC896_06035 [Bacteroidales bacterium]|nr:hypothetical protein [Bacteroidales bacterium]
MFDDEADKPTRIATESFYINEPTEPSHPNVQEAFVYNPAVSYDSAVAESTVQGIVQSHNSNNKEQYVYDPGNQYEYQVQKPNIEALPGNESGHMDRSQTEHGTTNITATHKEAITKQKSAQETTPGISAPSAYSQQQSDTGHIDGDVVYRVQIAASTQPMSKAELNQSYKGNNEVLEFKEDGYYKYYIGEYHNFFEAKKVKNSSGVKGSFIVAYKQTKKQSLMHAVAEQYNQLAPMPGLGKPNKIVKQLCVYYDFDKTTNKTPKN